MMLAAGPAKTGRIGQLDSLRGAAAILVVVHHSIQAHAHSVEDSWTGISAYLDLGRMGVAIFFMISGFVIAKAVPGHTPAAAALFWKHRFFRLYPPFWVSVAAAMLVAGLAGRSGCCVFTISPTPAMVAANLTMLPLRFHQTMLVGIYWTLELELLFYLLVTAFALARGTRYDTMLATGGLLFAAAVGMAGYRALTHGAGEIGKDQLVMVPLHLSLMFSGAAVRCHWDAQPSRTTFLTAMPPSLKLYYLAFGLFFAGVAAIKVRHGIDPHSFRVGATYLLSIAIFLLCLRRLDGSRLGTFLGDRSYGIYLLHLPVIGAVSYALSERPALRLGYLSYLAVVFVVTLASADLLRRLVERPAIRLGHRAGWRWHRTGAIAAGPG